MTFVRWVVLLIVFLALLFLALQNADLVTVRFYHWFSWEAPLILLLLIAFALGVGASTAIFSIVNAALCAGETTARPAAPRASARSGGQCRAPGRWRMSKGERP